jgi:DtxR family Mn-dependent transcriptional regulator
MGRPVFYLGVDMTSENVEEYLETIYKLEQDVSPVTTSALAKQLGISQASVSEMAGKLAAQGFVTREPYKGMALTAEGKHQALIVIRHHRLWERFLTDVLGLPWDQVHEEACRLEHVTSPLVEERLAQFLDEPETCPHGYPVAGADRGRSEESLPLSELEPGQRVVVLHVAEHNADLLRYLAELELRPQAVIEIEEVAPFDGPLTMRIGDNRRVVGRQVASQIAVRRA